MVRLTKRARFVVAELEAAAEVEEEEEWFQEEAVEAAYHHILIGPVA